MHILAIACRIMSPFHPMNTCREQPDIHRCDAALPFGPIVMAASSTGLVLSVADVSVLLQVPEVDRAASEDQQEQEDHPHQVLVGV